MNESFSFLLNLPNKALLNVIRNMEHPYQLGFSILSKRAIKLVKSLNLNARFLRVEFSNVITLTVLFANFHIIELNFQESSRELILRGNVHVRYGNLGLVLYDGTNGWNKQEYELSDWVHHISNVFNCSKVYDLSFLNGCNRYNIQSVYNIFKECEYINICIPFSSEYCQSILNTFNPIKQIQLSNISFDDRLHNIFIQNFDVLILKLSPFTPLSKIGLDHLLTMNSLHMEVNNSKLSDKELNGFIKHWINGSNRRMETLIIEYPRVIRNARNEIQNRRILNENVILNGVDYQTIPQQHRRIIKSSITGRRKYEKTFNGGYDIQRKDGTTATILITNWRNFSECKMEMFVWK